MRKLKKVSFMIMALCICFTIIQHGEINAQTMSKETAENTVMQNKITTIPIKTNVKSETAVPFSIQNKIKSNTVLKNVVSDASNATSIVFTNTIDTTRYPVDISENGDGSIMAWMSTSYQLMIGSADVVYAPEDATSLFEGLTDVSTINFNGKFDTSLTKNMARMFYNCQTLTTLDISFFNTTNVMDMSEMFYMCRELTGLDLKNFDTNNVTTMKGMFGQGFKLTSLDVSSFNTSKVTNMASMFNSLNILPTLNVSNFNTSNVTDMSLMFAASNGSSLTSLNVSNFDTSKVTNMSNMFANLTALTTLDISSWDTSSVTTMRSMFINCSSLTSLNVMGIDTSKVTDMAEMFNSLKALTSLDVSSLDTSSVTNMARMFSGSSSLTSLDLTTFDTSIVQLMYDMFSNMSALTSIDLSSFDISNCDTLERMFLQCISLTTIDLSSFDTSRKPNINMMFSGGPAGPMKLATGLARKKTDTDYLNTASQAGLGKKIFTSTIVDYTITYNNLEGATTSNPVLYDVNTATFTLSDPTARVGYTFKGWYDDAIYTNQITQIVKGSTGDKNLYAKWSKDTYTITYENLHETTSTNPKNYTIETPTIMLSDPTARIGYTFLGWFDGESESASEVTQITLGTSGNKTLYAKWELTDYAITYNNVHEATNSNPTTYTMDTDTITLSDPGVRAGYTFDGWFDKAAYTDQVTSITKGSTGDKTLYAKWKLITYTLLYDNLQGAATTNPATYNIETATITLSDPSARTGYTFVGWFDGESESASEVTEITLGSTENKTLYARWSADTYTLTYSNLQGTTTSNPISYTINTPTITLSEPTARTGYTFKGWYADAVYKNEITEITIGSRGNQTLYAKWSKDTYTIAYDNLQGTTTSNPTSYAIDTNTITLGDPTTRTGYTFVGWYDGTNETASEVTEITLGSTGNKTLYARWSVDTYTLMYSNLQGTTTDNPTSYTIDTPTITLSEPTARTGYTFKGWYVDAVYKNEITEITIGSVGNQTLYAKWEPATYQITYKGLKEGSNTNPITYTIETNDITLSSMPDTIGYTFVGWYDGAQDNANQITKIAKGSSGNLNLYARYTNRSVEIILQDGDNTQTKTVYFDKAYGELPTLEKAGYIFDGWYTKVDGKGKHIISETMVSNATSHKLYANWKQVYYENGKGNIKFEEGQDIYYQFKIENINITETMKKQEHLISIYDIYFLLNDERVSIKDNKMVIILNLNEKEKYYSHYKVVYFDENGKVVEEFNPTVASDYSTLSFETTHLSYYGIVAWNEEAPVVEPGNTSGRAIGVATGITMNDNGMYIALLVISLLCFGFTIRKKKNKDE